MAIQNEPTRIQIPFADSGTKNVIPDTNSTPSASQAASWTDGFPAQCSLPLSAGGIPPARADFNGILNAMTQSERFTQEGGVWAWDATVDYGTNRVVLGSDGLLYWSVAQSGPNVGGAQDPAADNGTYWQAMPMDNNNLVHKTGAEVVEGFKKFTDNITISGLNTNLTTLALQDENLEIGEDPQEEHQLRVVMADKVAVTSGHRFGTMRTFVEPNGDVYTVIEAWQNVSGSNIHGAVAITVLKDGTVYASAPSTLVSRNAGTDIVTRDWIPQDTRIVHSTGNESISGDKTFSDSIYSTSGNIFGATDNTGRLVVGGGKSYGYTQGAKGVFNGASNSQEGPAGAFTLHTGGSGHHILEGAPTGTLKWDGQTVQTSSDERIKTPLSEVPDGVLDAWEAVRWGQFKFLDAVALKGADAARLHLGLIAQRVKTVFEERGLDACAYGILCHEERGATEDEPASDLWMVRYTEALAMEAACQRRRADRAEARLAALEERLATIEAKINAQP